MSRPNRSTYKTLNWPEYNKALRRRGSLSIWFDPDMAWAAKPTDGTGQLFLASMARLHCGEVDESGSRLPETALPGLHGQAPLRGVR